MQIFIKITISVIIILLATSIARRFPSAAGLIGVMPLTGVLVMAWVFFENKADPQVMQDFVKGALWGLIPTIAFFSVALLCVKRGFSFPALLASSFTAWCMAAFFHQWILK